MRPCARPRPLTICSITGVQWELQPLLRVCPRLRLRQPPAEATHNSRHSKRGLFLSCGLQRKARRRWGGEGDSCSILALTTGQGGGRRHCRDPVWGRRGLCRGEATQLMPALLPIPSFALVFSLSACAIHGMASASAPPPPPKPQTVRLNVAADI